MTIEIIKREIKDKNLVSGRWERLDVSIYATCGGHRRCVMHACVCNGRMGPVIWGKLKIQEWGLYNREIYLRGTTMNTRILASLFVGCLTNPSVETSLRCGKTKQQPAALLPLLALPRRAATPALAMVRLQGVFSCSLLLAIGCRLLLESGRLGHRINVSEQCWYIFRFHGNLFHAFSWR